VVMILALAAAALYGGADFLGSVASRRTSVFAVLATTVPVGAVVAVVAALVAGGPAMGWGSAAWAALSGVFGTSGLVAFYAGFAAAPVSVVAPVAALISTVLPVGIAVVGGERLSPGMIAGGLICLLAIVLVSMPSAQHGAAVGRLRALGYGAAAGTGFGLFFLFISEAGRSGVLWPVAVSRSAGTLIAFGLALYTGTRPWRAGRSVTAIALISGTVDAAANVCYVLATRAGLFGLAVVITSLYPGVTVLLARVLLGERMRWLQRLGLLLAAAGVILLTA
jgi:drug/metabolite transporter (DMT)-like permease